MKLFTVVFVAAIVAVALTEDTTTTTDATSTSTQTDPSSSTTSTTPASTTSTSTTTSPTTTSSTTTTTAKPTTPSTTTTTTSTTTTTVAPPKPKEPSLRNYTVWNGTEVCASVWMRVIVSQNSTLYPFVNASLDTTNSVCKDGEVTVVIQSIDNYELQMVIKHDTSNFFIQQLSVDVNGLTGDKDNLTQFSTPLNQYYKCVGASSVDLGEHDLRVVFSDMKYQAFQKAKTADFVGAQFDCVSDYRSDVVIIAIGCALALLVVVILVAYLIARRKNRQRGYQSV